MFSLSCVLTIISCVKLGFCPFDELTPLLSNLVLDICQLTHLLSNLVLDICPTYLMSVTVKEQENTLENIQETEGKMFAGGS